MKVIIFLLPYWCLSVCICHIRRIGAKSVDHDRQDLFTSSYRNKIHSLWSNDVMWYHRSGSKLVQVMTCCLMAPPHYLNQCLLIINTVQRQSQEGNSKILNHQGKSKFLNHQLLSSMDLSYELFLIIFACVDEYTTTIFSSNVNLSIVVYLVCVH